MRDAVRDRDAAAINEAVLTIVNNGLESMVRLRQSDIPPSVEKELDLATEVVDWGTRTFTSYVGASVTFKNYLLHLTRSNSRVDRYQLDRYARQCSAPFQAAL